MANPVNFNPSKSKREAKAASLSRRAKRKAAARAAEVRAEKSRALDHNREVVRSRAEALEWSEGSAERGRLRTDALSRYAAGRPAPAGLEEVYAEIVRDAVEDEYGDAEAFRAGWVDTDKDDPARYNPRKKTKTRKEPTAAAIRKYGYVRARIRANKRGRKYLPALKYFDPRAS